MKKIISLMVLLVMCCSFVFAVNGPAGRINQRLENQNIIASQIQEKSEVKGLENAMVMVRTQERKEHLEQVMNKIKEHRRTMLNNMENLEIEEDEEGIKATGQREAMFLNAFKFKRNFQYRINEEGEVKRIRAWYDFLWKFEGDVE